MVKSPAPQPAYEYACTLLRVLDGDTIEVRVDLGFRTHIETPLRLLGVNAPEKNTLAGQRALDFTRSWLALTDAYRNGLWIRSAHPGQYSGDKYGRWLATVKDVAGRTLNEDLLAAGHAVAMLD